jgi:hypothetical protein
LKNSLKNLWSNIKILGIVILILVLISVIKIVYFGFDSNDLDGLLLNFFTELLGAVAVFILVDRVLEGKKELEKEYFLKEIIVNKYKSILNILTSNYINLVTHEPQKLHGNETPKLALKKVVENLSSYIDKEFYKKEGYVLLPNDKDIFKPIKQPCSTDDLIVLMKMNYKKAIPEFIDKYALHIPKDVLDKLCKIENLIGSPALSTFKENGLNIPLKNVGFEPEMLIKLYNEIGETILELHNYTD